MYVVCFQLTCGLAGGQQMSFEWGRVRCFDKEVATMFLNQIKDIKSTKYVLLVTCLHHRLTEPPVALCAIVFFSCPIVGINLFLTSFF